MPEPLDPYRPDCSRCQGLCCVAPAHRRTDGFPVAKNQDTACRHLDCKTFRCRAFDRLEAQGYTTCRAYDCFGAGPQVTRWLTAPWPGLPEDITARRLDDFRRLSRLRCLLAHMMNRPELRVHPLRAVLEGIVVGFDETGVLPEPATVNRQLMEHGTLVGEMIRAVGYNTAAAG